MYTPGDKNNQPTGQMGIQVRMGSQYPVFVLNGILRMRPQKPRTPVKAGVSLCSKVISAESIEQRGKTIHDQPTTGPVNSVKRYAGEDSMHAGNERMS